jgi:hypothetical protein
MTAILLDLIGKVFPPSPIGRIDLSDSNVGHEHADDSGVIGTPKPKLYRDAIERIAAEGL